MFSGSDQRRITARPAVAVLVFCALLAPAACRKGDRFESSRRLLTRYADALDAFSEAVDKAKDSKPIAAALDLFVDTAWSLAPQIKDLGKSRPEMSAESGLPADMGALLTRVDASHARMLAAMTKVMQYADDPAIPAARARLEGLQKLLE
jgi:hypothetical protein